MPKSQDAPGPLGHARAVLSTKHRETWNFKVGMDAEQLEDWGF